MGNANGSPRHQACVSCGEYFETAVRYRRSCRHCACTRLYSDSYTVSCYDALEAGSGPDFFEGDVLAIDTEEDYREMRRIVEGAVYRKEGADGNHLGDY